MAKLTDKQRKKIIADRADGATLRALARKYHVSDTTIRRTLHNNPEVAEKVARKKRRIPLRCWRTWTKNKTWSAI